MDAQKVERQNDDEQVLIKGEHPIALDRHFDLSLLKTFGKDGVLWSELQEDG